MFLTVSIESGRKFLLFKFNSQALLRQRKQAIFRECDYAEYYC